MKDRNNLALSSTFFRDKEKYDAFCAFYAVMRVVDDRIDELPNRPVPSPAAQCLERDVVSGWREAMAACISRRDPGDFLERCRHPQAASLLEAVAQSLEIYDIPLSLWESFFNSMQSDINPSQFETWGDFLAYSAGASCAPTTIYLLLLGTRREGGKSPSLVPGFDPIGCGRHLGIFAYIGHILRDLAMDLRTGENGVLYLTREDMDSHGVTRATLFADLDRGQASPGLRRLVSELVGRARRHLARGRADIGEALSEFEPDCRFILRLIVAVYERILDRIEESSFDPFARPYGLTPSEKWEIVVHVAEQEGFVPWLFHGKDI